MAYEVEYSADRANALRNLQVADHSSNTNWAVQSDVSARSGLDLDEDGKGGLRFSVLYILGFVCFVSRLLSIIMKSDAFV